MNLKSIKYFAVAAIVAALWSVAPALSVEPYLPEAVDFEQQLPRAEPIPGSLTDRVALAEGGGAAANGFATDPIEAPKRFDFVGLAGEERPFDIRTRTDGEDWSEWVETSDGGPVYAGGADWLQIRSDFRPRGTLHYVNVSGSSSLVDSVVTRLRKSVNSAVIAMATSPALGAAHAPKPTIIKRRAWGGDGCETTGETSYGKVKAAAVHHTVSTNTYTEEQAPGIVLGICRYHVNGNGWNDIGYNFLVDRFGNVYEGRDGGVRRSVIGAHAQGYNTYTTGVAVIGDHSTARITAQTKRSLKKVLAWKLSIHEVPKATGRTRITSGGGSVNRYSSGTTVRLPRIFSHGDANYTECSGSGVERSLRKIRTAVQRRMEKYAGAPAEDPGTAGETGSGGVSVAS